MGDGSPEPDATSRSTPTGSGDESGPNDLDDRGDGDADDRSGADGRRPHELVGDDRIVEVASDAARDLVFARFDAGEIRDLDVTVTFEDAVLEVDVYLDVPDPGLADPDRVVDDAAVAAQRAVDELFADVRADDPD